MRASLSISPSEDINPQLNSRLGTLLVSRRSMIAWWQGQ
jgi:hypothetical protein